MRQSLLLVDDHSTIATSVAAVLGEIGVDVAAHARSVEEAAEYAWRKRFDVALLKSHVGRRSTAEVRDWLELLGVPFVLMTSGHCRDDLPLRLKNAPRLRIPFAATDLVHSIARATGLLAPPRPLPGIPKGRIKDAEIDAATAFVSEMATRVARLEMIVRKYSSEEAELALGLARGGLTQGRQRLMVLERRLKSESS